MASNPVPSAENGRGQHPRRKTMLEKIHDSQLQTKPGGIHDTHGGAGQPASLIVNYISVDFLAPDAVKQYHVEFQPAVVLENKRKGVVREWARQKQIPDASNTYDGGSTIYAPAEKIPPESVDVVLFDGEQVTVRLRRVGPVQRSSPEFICFLNVQMARFLENELQLVRAEDGYFDPQAAKRLNQDRLEIWPGFETSIGEYEGGKHLMSIDQRFKVIRDETAWQVLQAKLNQLQGSGAALEKIRAEAGRSLIGSFVETRYNNRTYRVIGVDWSKSLADDFEIRNLETNIKRRVTMKDYTENRYGLQIAEMNQPLLEARSQNRQGRRRQQTIWLVPELCRMCGLTETIRTSHQTMKRITEVVKPEPAARKSTAAQFAWRLAGNERIKAQLATWGISYGSELIQIQGRNLGMQSLMQGNVKLPYEVPEADWSKRTRATAVEDPKSISRWLCIFPAEFSDLTREFVAEMKTVAGPMGIKIEYPRLSILRNTSADAYLHEIRQKRVDTGCQLVIAILPDDKKDRYDAVKHQTCCITPCPSQVILKKTISNEKGRKSIATKVVQQINVKLGGPIWRCSLPFKEPTMVVGIDTHRDKQQGKLVVAAAATQNLKFGMYASFTARVDQDGVVLVVPGLIEKCFEAFKKANKDMCPARVIVYRDGDTSDIRDIYTVECRNVASMLKAPSTQQKIKLTYVLVNRNPALRAFRRNPIGERVVNPLPGTLVDHTVTRTQRYEFFLASHAVREREGTTALTHYNVIHEENGLSPDQLQTITYLLCHMYFNWAGTIRVPAPCQYARKYASFIAENIHEEAARSLADKLFYI